MSRNHFKQKIISGLDEIDFKLEKNERVTDYSFSPTSQLKSPRIARFKLCTSKNVCVFSNLKKVEFEEKPQKSLYLNKDLKTNDSHYRNSARNST